MIMIYVQNKINKTPETFVGRPPLFPLLIKEGCRGSLIQLYVSREFLEILFP